MRIIIQIGYSKAQGSRREGQKISAFINDVECTWGDKSGQFLTSFLDTKKGLLWYLWAGELEDGDAIRIQVATGVVGGGTDEKRTFDSVYVVDESASVTEVEVSGVGRRGYPLVKGRVTALGSVSELDNREADIEAFLDDEGF